jgi:predicted acylesterase/phospholipase RssA
LLAIVFEGCACRAAFHAGVAASLAEAHLPIALAAGSSSGSIVAAALVAGHAADLPRFFSALGGRSLVSFRRWFWNRSPFDMSFLVRNALRDSLGTLDLRHRPAEALISATRARSLRPIVFSSRYEHDLLEPILGSCFFPPLYGRWVRVRGELLLDGGLVDNLPTEPVVARGAKDIIAVVASHDGTAMRRPLAPRIRPHEETRARVHVVHPSAPLQIGSWDFDPLRMRAAIDDGRRQGAALAERLLRRGAAR